jgi:hypothetical protein
MGQRGVRRSLVTGHGEKPGIGAPFEKLPCRHGTAKA